MKHLASAVLIFAVVLAVSAAVPLTKTTLQQVHVIFRHGDRTPDKISMYPNDPHLNDTWFPEGLGALTKRGKIQEFNIGKALRRRYDPFLGRVYTPDVLDARSTNYDRTKMSLQLVLAGLWPPAPSQTWNDLLPWQPIPYNSETITEGKIMKFPVLANCPIYKEEYDKAYNLNEVQEFLRINAPLISYINEHSGLNSKSLLDLFILYFGLYAEEHTGRNLPEWTKKVYPDFLEKASVLQYQTMTYSETMLRVSGGQFVKKVIDDATSKMNGTLVPMDRKLYLYSGHEYNVAYTLAALNIYKPHIPPYAAYIAVELHKTNNQYGMKVYYQDYSEPKPHLMDIPGCRDLCPFEQFVELTERIIPQSDAC